MALTTLDGLIGGQKLLLNHLKTATMGTATAGTTQSLWAATGGSPGAGAAPGNTTAGMVPDATTAGAMSFAAPTSGGWYIMGAGAVANAAVSVIFWDRAWAVGALTPTNGSYASFTGATSATGRLASGEGYEAWVEIQTVHSAVAHTLTVTYTAQDGTAGRTGTVIIPASAPAQRMYPITLAAGDTGVRAITALSGSSAPTGTFNVILLRRLLNLAVPASIAISLDLSQTGLLAIPASACLMVSVFQQTTTALVIQSSLSLVAG